MENHIVLFNYPLEYFHLINKNKTENEIANDLLGSLCQLYVYQVVFPLINFPCLERDDYRGRRGFIPIVNLKR